MDGANKELSTMMSRAREEIRQQSLRGNQWALIFLSLDPPLRETLLEQIATLKVCCASIGVTSAIELLYRLGRWERNQSRVDRRRFERVMGSTQAGMTERR